MMMDDRKRPFPFDGSADSGNSQSKKIQLDRSLSNTSISNGKHRPSEAADAADESPAYKGLEEFRKEAIYRRFLEGQRDLARAERRILLLQRDLSSFEHRSASFQRCWETLTEDIKSLLTTNSLQQRKEELSSALDASKHAKDAHSLQEAMQSGAIAIRTIFSTIAGEDSRLTPSQEELQARCQKLAEEAASLRHQANSTQAAFERAAQELQEATSKLKKAEKQRDRLLSPSVRSVEKVPELPEENAAGTPGVEATQQDRGVKKEGTPSEARSTPLPFGMVNGTQHSTEQAEDLERIANSRLAEAETLRQELLQLRTANETLRAEADSVPDTKIAESSTYLELRQHAVEVQNELSRAKAEWEAVQVENVELREARANFEQLSKEQANLVLEELRKQLQIKDADILRLRGQRDELQSDLAERKQREAIKTTEKEELKSLLALKEQNAQKLRADVRRLQIVLAGRRGDGATLSGLLGIGGSEATDEQLDVEGQLKRQAQELQEAIEGLKAKNEALTAATEKGDLAGQCAELAARVKELEGLTKDAEGSDACAKLKAQEEKIKVLQAKVEATDATIAELCTEIDRLGSVSTSDVEREYASRVVELSKLEERIVRLTSEKSKADNKYFSAMRAKDAVDAEKQVLNRTLERQSQLIERYTEAEKAFAAQVQLHEQEVTLMRKSLDEHKTRLADLQIAVERATARDRELTAKLLAANERLQVEIQTSETSNAARARLEERVAQLEKDLERSKKAIAHGGSRKSSMSLNTTDAELEALNSLLRCSSCKERYRDRVIVKCLHTFCAQCMETRIATRQRKCPHCGLTFAVSDVQPLYLQ